LKQSNLIPDSKKFKEEKLEAKSNSEKGQKAESSDAEDDKDDDIPEDIDSDSIEWV